MPFCKYVSRQFCEGRKRGSHEQNVPFKILFHLYITIFNFNLLKNPINLTNGSKRTGMYIIIHNFQIDLLNDYLSTCNQINPKENTKLIR